MTYKYKSILEEIEEEFETKKMNSSNNSLPIFPIDIFPEKVKRYAEICAKNLPCPIDYMGSFILGSISAMISNSRRVLIKDGWREPAVLWLGVIGSPSTKKTPALNKSIKPLHDKQTAYYDEYKRLKVEYKKQQQDFSNMEGLSEDAIENPSLLQLYTTDAT